MKQELHWFEKYAKVARDNFSWISRYNDKTREKLNKYFSDDYIKNLNFSGLNIAPYDILLLSYMGAFISFVIVLFFDLIVILTYSCDLSNIDIFTIILMITVTFFFQ